jgi:hypothetical protein
LVHSRRFFAITTPFVWGQFLTYGDFVGQMRVSSCFFHAERSDNDNHLAICYRETGSKSREAC